MSKRKMNTGAMSACLLCDEAKCRSACPHFDPSKALRSLWFDNENGARAAIPDSMPCAGCDAPCAQACPQSGKIDIRDLMLQMGETHRDGSQWQSNQWHGQCHIKYMEESV